MQKSLYFFVNVAENIGKDYVFYPNDHPSITKIENKNFNKEAFEFKPTDHETVSKNQ